MNGDHLGRLVSQGYPLAAQIMRAPTGSMSSALIVRPFAGVLVISLSTLSSHPVLADARGVLNRLASSVLIAVTGVLDELRLGAFKPFGLTLAGLGQRSPRLTRVAVGRGRR
jgi:hypothetical protein